MVKIRHKELSKKEIIDTSSSQIANLEKALQQKEKELRRCKFKLQRLEMETEVSNRFLQTSVQELEEKNLLLEKYFESNLQLENFAHIASHDLKAPLNNILSFSGLLQKTSNGKLSPSEEKFVAFIIEAAKNMRKTIHSLLRFSLVTNAKIEITSFNPNELLLELKRDLASTLSQKKATLQLSPLPNSITGDITLLREVFQNIILNGVKFIDIKTSPIIEISCEENKTHWVFSVKDNGIGIPEEFKKKIFIMLQRLNTGKEYDGTGMGLSICKKIIEHHGGEIWVDSEVGTGSVFYFSVIKKMYLDVA